MDKLTPVQHDMMAMGKCPFCEASIRGWKPLFGSFAPEWWEIVRESGRDPESGHMQDCVHKDIHIAG